MNFKKMLCYFFWGKKNNRKSKQEIKYRGKETEPLTWASAQLTSHQPSPRGGRVVFFHLAPEGRHRGVGVRMQASTSCFALEPSQHVYLLRGRSLDTVLAYSPPLASSTPFPLAIFVTAERTGEHRHRILVA